MFLQGENFLRRDDSCDVCRTCVVFTKLSQLLVLARQGQSEVPLSVVMLLKTCAAITKLSLLLALARHGQVGLPTGLPF